MSSRREFIKNVTLALPTISLAQLLLDSCKKPEKPIDEIKVTQIGIIGAGLSGLHAASLLLKIKNIEVTILEATDNLGGRIMNAIDYENNVGLDIGAQYVYGNNNEFFDTISNHLVKVPNNNLSFYQIDSKLLNSNNASNDDDFKKVENALKNTLDYVNINDESIEEFSHSQLLPERALYLFKEMMERNLGSSIDRVSLLNNIENIKNISTSEKFKVSGSTLFNVINNQYSDLKFKTKFNSVVHDINHEGEQIVVNVIGGEKSTYKFDKLIVTVPLGILKENKIKFKPSLPDEKVKAMDKLGFCNGIKVFMKVRSKPWADNAKTIYFESIFGCFDIISESNNQYLICADLKGKDADAFSNKSDREIVDIFIDDFENYFGVDTFDEMSFKVYNWHKFEFIKGTYSYHKVGGSHNDRTILAEPINKKIFFAGEATASSKEAGTLQGAFSSAIRVVEELKATLV